MTGREFRKIRLHLDLTQEALAKRLGMARNTVTRWEIGLMRVPPIAALAMKGLLAEERGSGKRTAG